MATFPAGAISFTSKSNGDTITPTFFNSPQDEIAAIETFLRSSLFNAVNASCLPVTTAYTPTWGNTGTANSLGNGTITGNYIQIGKLVLFDLSLVFGSTTTSGNGGWTFTVPVAGPVAYGFTVLMGDASAGLFYGGSTVALNTTTFYVEAVDNATPARFTLVSVSTPFTWTTSDSINIRGFYFAS